MYKSIRLSWASLGEDQSHNILVQLKNSPRPGVYQTHPLPTEITSYRWPETEKRAPIEALTIFLSLFYRYFLLHDLLFSWLSFDL